MKVRANVWGAWSILLFCAALIITVTAYRDHIPIIEEIRSWSFVLGIAVIGGILMSIHRANIYIQLDGDILTISHGIIPLVEKFPVADVIQIKKEQRRQGIIGDASYNLDGTQYAKCLQFCLKSGHEKVINVMYMDKESVKLLIQRILIINPGIYTNIERREMP